MTPRRQRLSTTPPRGDSRRVIHDGFRSNLLDNTRTITVHLPPGYESEREERYPVLYFHDGQNVFDSSRAAFGVAWEAGETTDRLTRAGRLRQVILVGIDNTVHRLDEYGWHHDAAHNAGGKGELYGRFLVEEVKPFIDRSYHTLPGRAQTGLLGSSMGGLITLALARAYPRVFSRCGILSPSLWWAREALLDEIEGDPAWMANARFWLCMGTREGVKRGHLSPHLKRTRRLVELFDRTGLLPGRDYCYWEVAGGEHNEAAWAARLDKVLLYLFGW